MANEKRLIDANAFKMFLEVVRQGYLEEDTFSCDFAAQVIETVQDEYLANATTVDAVEVKCKVGDWVYALWEAPVKQKYIIYCAEVKEIRIGMRNRRLTTTYRLEPIMYRGHIHEYRDEDFGKLVFSSEEEAKNELAKMDGGNEE